MEKKILLQTIGLIFITNFIFSQVYEVETCQETIEIQEFADSEAIENAMARLVENGAPGAAIAIFSNQGWWYTAQGLACIEKKSPMQICHLQFLQSVAKTYHAVAILKLYEEGKIRLDSPITDYLPKRITDYISKAKDITIKMLLNHTSGVPEYNFNPNYVAKLLQSPQYNFSGEDYLKYINQKPLDFEPGSQYSYRNTNYLLLALILDELTGNHAEYIENKIFKPLQLNETYYRNTPNYLDNPKLVNSYWDRNSTGIIENASYLQRQNVKNLIGDDGIIATPIDAVKFLKGLVEGKLLSEKTIQLMKTWVQRDNGEDAYGLGLGYHNIDGIEVFGHSGGGIGSGCELYYIPNKNLYFFIAINLGTVTDSPLHEGIGKIREEIYAILLK
ncbi:MAG: serine hydrolase domain-containing protein [Flavobacteriaceae bacterium]|nr:serine hydrolase domain-containing protein [Flavobacteriaceae bacterium]